MTVSINEKAHSLVCLSDCLSACLYVYLSACKGVIAPHGSLSRWLSALLNI